MIYTQWTFVNSNLDSCARNIITKQLTFIYLYRTSSRNSSLDNSLNLLLLQFNSISDDSNLVSLKQAASLYSLKSSGLNVKLRLLNWLINIIYCLMSNFHEKYSINIPLSEHCSTVENKPILLS